MCLDGVVFAHKSFVCGLTVDIMLVRDNAGTEVVSVLLLKYIL